LGLSFVLNDLQTRVEGVTKYQTPGRIKFRELWVPAGTIVEEGREDEDRMIRADPGSSS
jgi:hypothetical protein